MLTRCLLADDLIRGALLCTVILQTPHHGGGYNFVSVCLWSLVLILLWTSEESLTFLEPRLVWESVSFVKYNDHIPLDLAHCALWPDDYISLDLTHCALQTEKRQKCKPSSLINHYLCKQELPGHCLIFDVQDLRLSHWPLMTECRYPACQLLCLAP